MTNKAVGICVSKNTLQVVVLSRGHKKARLLTADSIKIPQSVVIGAGTNVEAQALFEADVMRLLRTNNIKEGEVVAVALPPDLVAVRYFQMARLSQEECKTAVPFEARKYLPYKLEDIDFAYTISHDKVASNKMAVTFAAAEKSAIAGCIKFFKKLNMKVEYLEPVPYSCMRLLYHIKEIEASQIGALVYIDEDTASINLIRNRVLYLTRNLSFSGRISSITQIAMSAIKEEGLDKARMDSLFAEVRLSFDYFHRQFPEERIEKMLVWSDHKDLQGWAQDVGKDLNVQTKVSNPLQNIEGAADRPSQYAAACGLALRRLYKPDRDINLSPAFKKIQTQRFKNLLITEACIAAAALFMFYLADVGTVKTLQLEFDKMTGQLSDNLQTADLSKPAIEHMRYNLESKLSQLERLVDNRISVGSKLKKVAELLPQGLWLDKIDYTTSKGTTGQRLKLVGYAYQTQADNRIKTINLFLENLKKDSEFSESFPVINLDAISNTRYADMALSRFEISCAME